MVHEHALGGPDIHELVRRLTDAVCQSGARPSAGDCEPAVLLDVAVEGVRCVLIRFDHADRARRPALSPREREIVRMVAQGHPNKAIAAVLDISAWTVSTHVRRVFAKLSVNSRAAMVARLISEGDLSQPGS